MRQKILIFALISTLIFYFSFSFYYNSEILTLNQNFQKNNSLLKQLQLQNQFLQNNYTQAISINKLMEAIDISLYQPIKKTININQGSLSQ